MSGQWTDNGLELAAQAIQTPGTNAAITYIGVGTGCGTMAGNITAGTPLTSLTLNAGIPAALAGSTELSITDGTNVETVTVVSGGALINANPISINSWTPVNNYAANVTVVAPVPLGSDSSLYNETERAPVAAASAGATPGESLISSYFDGTQPTGVYYSVGYFGGATATATPGTGILMANDLNYWDHVQYSDTNMIQGDGTL
jgi:hypothetical protein